MCNVGEAASKSFLYSLTVDEKTLRDVNAIPGITRSAILICPSYKLVNALVSAFDADGDNTLIAQEKALMLSTLLTNPEVAVNKVITGQSIRLPQVTFYGSCGRLTLTEGQLKPVSAYLDQSLDVRKGIGKILRTIFFPR